MPRRFRYEDGRILDFARDVPQDEAEAMLDQFEATGQVPPGARLLGDPNAPLQRARQAAQGPIQNVTNLLTAPFAAPFSGAAREELAARAGGAPPEQFREPRGALTGILGQILNPVPGSIPEAALLPATAAGGRLAALAPRGARAITRVGVPAATSQVMGAVAGEDPVQTMVRSALTVAFLGGAELAGPAARGISRYVGRIAGRRGLQDIGVEDAASVINAIRQDVPALAPHLDPSRPASLTLIRDPARGMATLKGVFQQADDAASQALAGVNLAPNAPALVRYATKYKGVKVPKGQQPDLRIEQAQQLLKDLKAEARLAQASKEPATKFPVIDLARKAEEQYRAILPPERRQQYDQAVDQFGKGLSILDALRESKAVVSEERGTFVNLRDFAEHLRENIESLSPTRFPNLYREAFRESPELAQDVLLTLAGGGSPQRAGARIPFLPGRPFATVRAPQQFFRAGAEPAGSPLANQEVLNLLALLSTMGLREGAQGVMRRGQVPGGE